MQATRKVYQTETHTMLHNYFTSIVFSSHFHHLIIVKHYIFCFDSGETEVMNINRLEREQPGATIWFADLQ